MNISYKIGMDINPLSRPRRLKVKSSSMGGLEFIDRCATRRSCSTAPSRSLREAQQYTLGRDGEGQKRLRRAPRLQP